MNADEIVKALRCYASDCSDDDACFQCTFAWMCNKLDGNAPKVITDLIESLQAQLSESQRRERAAVEDLKRFSACCQCNANIDGSCCDMFDGTAENKYFCSNWQWRGSQEAEKGDALNE